MHDAATLTHRLADFAGHLTVTDIPPEQVRYLTRLVADTVACAFAARGRVVLQLVSYAERHSPPDGPHATLLPMRDSRDLAVGYADAAQAALVNTAAARELDANDLYLSLVSGDGGHFSSAIPALLATAEIVGATGAELLAAIAAAYESQALLCDATNWTAAGWNTAGLLAWTLPASLARLRRLPVERTAAACAIAGITGQTFPSWLRPGRPVTAMKTLAPGIVARHAVEAVELAAMDMTAPGDALERTLAHVGVDAADLPWQRLGREWTIGRNLLKRYPAQYLTQGAVQAALELHRRGVRAEAVREVRVIGHAGVCGGVQGSARAFAPETSEDADHSTPFVVATALLRGHLTPADYEGNPWSDSSLRELMDRIHLILDPAREQARQRLGIIGCRVEVERWDGRSQAAHVRQPAGHPDAPLTDDELVRKMAELLGKRFEPDLPVRLLAACDALPTAPSLDALLATLRPLSA